MNDPKIKPNIRQEEWCACLTLCRDTRALILRNSEAFQEAATVLETIGQIIGGKIKNGLGGYKACLIELAAMNPHADSAETTRLFEKVQDERNGATHEGAWARHANSRLIDLLLILEEAIMTKLRTAEDVMVRNPVIAEGWHMASHARRTMLENSFSYLPIYIEEKWYLISDVQLIKYLNVENEGNDLRAVPLEQAIQCEKLKTTLACHVLKETPLLDLRKQIDHLPVLVTLTTHSNGQSDKRLLGIITPFDLL